MPVGSAPTSAPDLPEFLPYRHAVGCSKHHPINIFSYKGLL